MKTVSDNRRDWLEFLIQEHGSISALNIALGRVKTDATLSQIRSKSAHSRTGAPRAMGEKIARDFEQKLGLAHGSLDGPAPGTAKEVGQAVEGLQVYASNNIATYRPNRWPFLTVKPEDWDRIPFATRQMIELQIKALTPAPQNTGPGDLQETPLKTGTK
jgi:hypothetical protein